MQDVAEASEPMQHEILTVDEAATLLRVPRSWVYANSSALRGSKIGKYVRFKRADIDEYLRARRCGH